MRKTMYEIGVKMENKGREWQGKRFCCIRRSGRENENESCNSRRSKRWTGYKFSLPLSLPSVDREPRVDAGEGKKNDGHILRTGDKRTACIPACDPVRREMEDLLQPPFLIDGKSDAETEGGEEEKDRQSLPSDGSSASRIKSSHKRKQPFCLPSTHTHTLMNCSHVALIRDEGESVGGKEKLRTNPSSLAINRSERTESTLSPLATHRP